MKNINTGESIREKEYNSGTMFAGKLKELVEKRALPKQRDIIDFHTCSLTLANNVLGYIADSVTICHSPSGCTDDMYPVTYLGAKARGLELNMPYQYEMKNAHLCSTSMNEDSIVFGGEEELYNSIIEAKKRYDPQIIFVLGSCASAIIGDDIDAVCKKASESLGDEIIILPIQAHGFQTISWTNSYDVVWDQLIKRVVRPPEIKCDNLVNCFVPSTGTVPDMEEVERLLNKMDLDVQFIPDLQSIDTIKTMSESALNTSLCSCSAHHAMRLLKDKYNMPFVETPFLIGIDLTSKWLMDIGKVFGKVDQAKKIIEEEVEAITPDLEKMRKKLKGKTAYVTANHTKTVGYTKMCHELGFEIIGAGFHMVDDISKGSEIDLLNSVGDIDVIVGSPIYEELNHIKKLKPDIIIAHGEIAPLFSTIGIACKQTYNYCNQGAHTGFRGLIETGHRIYKVMTNPIREKLFKYRHKSNLMDFTSIDFLKEDDAFAYIDQFNFLNQKKCGKKSGRCKKRLGDIKND